MSAPVLLHFQQFEAPGPSPSGPLRQEWCYTDGPQPIVANLLTWQPIGPVSLPEVEGSSEKVSGTISIEVAYDNAVAQLFRTGYPSRRVFLTVRDASTYLTRYKGYVTGCEASGRKATLHIEPITSIFRLQGLRITHDEQCQWALYSERCGVSRAAYTVAGAIESISADGRTLTSVTFATQPDGYFTLGDIEIAGSMRTIDYHAGNTIRMLAPIDGLTVGTAFSASRGCNRLAGVGGCSDFNNQANYGGAVNRPSDTPGQAGL